MKEQNCPCCPNHCDKNNLSCPRGENYFNTEKQEKSENSIKDQIIADLRRCGHILHHNRNIEANTLLDSITDEESNKLHELLEKICSNQN